jgi:hypothetical protein
MSISGRCRQLPDVLAVFAARRSHDISCMSYRVHFLMTNRVLALVPSPSGVNIVCLIDFPRTSTSATADTDVLGENCTRNTDETPKKMG